MTEETKKKLSAQRSMHEAEWAAAMDSSDDSIYILDPDRHIIRANKAFYRMTNSSPATAIGRPITEIVHPQGELEPCPVCRAQEEKKDAIIIMEADHPDNPAGVPMEIVVKVIRDKAGNPLSIFMSLHDLTEGRKLVEEKRILEEKFMQAQKMESVGRLTGGIAHDFNNILTAILGYSELLLLDMSPGDPHRKIVETIRLAGEKANALTRQLLAFSRKQILNVKPLPLNNTIDSLLNILRKMVGEDIEITPDLRADNDTIEADQSQIEQVLMNLAVNARDAMPAGGNLIIRTQNIIITANDIKMEQGIGAGSYVMLSVTDFGEGMDKEVLDHLFDPFFTTKEQGKGTGLGLATVHGIIKQHNGQISVFSEPKRGTTFKIYFPISNKPVENDKTEDINLIHNGETILVVDDDKSIRQLIIDTLAPLGYKCLEAADGTSAINLAQTTSEEIHLLLTDVIMPGLNGKDLAKIIHQERPAIKTIFISGYSENVIASQGILNHDVNYLPKPLTPTLLAAKVHNVLAANQSEECLHDKP